MKRSEFLKSSALMGTGLFAVPGALGCSEKKDNSAMPLSNTDKDPDPIPQGRFMTTVDLSNNVDWQFLYGSQLYGTLFAMFGKFNAGPTELEGEYQIDQIELRIINYKGDMSIGFASDEVKNFYKEDIDGLEIGLSLELEKLSSEGPIKGGFLLNVMGGVGNFKKIETLKNNNRFRKGELIWINRTLFPLRPVDWRKPSRPDDLDPNPISQNYEIFDSEFFERDGYGLRRKRIKKGHFKPDPRNAPSLRCHQAYVNIVF